MSSSGRLKGWTLVHAVAVAVIGHGLLAAGSTARRRRRCGATPSEADGGQGTGEKPAPARLRREEESGRIARQGGMETGLENCVSW